jgi:hypothetical protein
MSGDLKLTATRLDLLKAVAAGEVKHRTGSRPSEDCDEWKRPGEVAKKVTVTVKWLRDAGLIANGPKEHASFFAPAPWLLTEVGEHYLNTYA